MAHHCSKETAQSKYIVRKCFEGRECEMRKMREVIITVTQEYDNKH